MDITPVVTERINIIDGYDARGFTVRGEYRQGALLILPRHLFEWQRSDPDTPDIGEDDLAPLKSLPEPIDTLLVGTGRIFRPLSPALRAAFHSFGMEAMDSAAACRTYNILLMEGLRTGLALLPAGL